MEDDQKSRPATMWNPWRGCHRYSDGCRYCYIHKGDAKRGVNTDEIVKTDKFTRPVDTYVKGKRSGEYMVSAGTLVYLCFSSDFLLADADEWRGDCWRMIKARSDLDFLFLTKRIERFEECAPPDWGDGYDNVIVGCTVENQETADSRLSVFDTLPIKHKNIICQPMIGEINLESHLDGIELVVVGGESDRNGRVLDYNWVLSIREQCIRKNVRFEFRQCATNFLKDGVQYKLNVNQLGAQARKANINT